MKKAQKTLERQVKDLQNKIEQNENRTNSKRDELMEVTQELDWLRRQFTLNGRDEKLLPSELESEFIQEERESRLYLPLIQAIEDDDELDLASYIYKGDTPQEVLDYVEDCRYEIIDWQTEFIYYYDAIKYLEENDQSLTESLELAYNLWYDLKNLNSCILASLLKQEDENLYWKFDDEMELLKEKAEELEEAREENEKVTGLSMDEFIEQRAKNRTARHTSEDWTPKELQRIQELEAKREELENQKSEGCRNYWKLKEELNKKEIELKNLIEEQKQW